MALSKWAVRCAHTKRGLHPPRDLGMHPHQANDKQGGEAALKAEESEVAMAAPLAPVLRRPPGSRCASELERPYEQLSGCFCRLGMRVWWLAGPPLRDAVPAQASSANAPRTPLPTTQVFKRAETEKELEARRSSHAYFQEQLDAEPWSEARLLPADSGESVQLRSQLFGLS